MWRDRPARELAALALKEAKLAALIGYGKTPVAPAGLSVRELDLARPRPTSNWPSRRDSETYASSSPILTCHFSFHVRT